MNFREAALISFVLLTLSLSLLGCSDVPIHESAGTARENVTGGDSTNVTFSQAMPYRAVGFLQLPAGQCTGTAIQRDTILTAAHCFFDSGGVTQAQIASGAVRFHLLFNNGTANTDLIGGDGNAGLRSRAPGPNTLGTADIRDGDGSTAEKNRWADLAVVFLERQMTTQELPQVVPVVTSANTLQIPFAAQIVGWDGSTTVKNAANLSQGIAFDNSCGFFGQGSCGPTWIDTESGGDNATIQPGDSGGPFLDISETPATIVAVVSGKNNPAIGPNEDVYSPTFNVGGQPIDNGTWLSQFILDGDGDGVNDNVDNCPPSKCIGDPRLKCFNPNQEDLDGDGWGDACDNCPPSLCQTLWGNGALCANPSQTDATDMDGVGDACDTCPNTPDWPGRAADEDHDGVGNGCDDCLGVPNAYAACTTDAACSGANQGGKCLGAADPELRKFGRCNGGKSDGLICASNAQCPGGACASVGSFGRCLAQSNRDGDSFGDACDVCRDQKNDNAPANSNIAAENRAGSEPLGDVCDPAPLFVSRPIAQEIGAPTADLGVFQSSAGIGAATPFSTTVGFRWCNCVTPGVDRETCFRLGLCDITVAFDAPEGAPGNPWHRVTTGSFGPSPGPVIGPPPMQYDAPPILRTFDNRLTCNAAVVNTGAAGEGGPCRVGPLERVFWNTPADVAANHVQTFDGTHTIGLFWSHGLLTASGFSDPRDSITNGGLRDNYELLRTPVVRVPEIIIPAFPIQGRCELGPCQPYFRRDWLSDPAPNTLLASRLPALTSLSRLVFDPARSLVGAVRGPGEPVLDVTTSLSVGLLDLIRDPGQRFATPVETGARGSGTAPILQSVALPIQWRQGVSTINPIVVTSGGGLATLAELEDIPRITKVTTNVESAATTDVVPSDRFGARAILSATDSSVYLVGGRRGDENGSPTGEIWRFDLTSQSWIPVFTRLPVERLRSRQRRATSRRSRAFCNFDQPMSWRRPTTALAGRCSFLIESFPTHHPKSNG